MENLPLQIIKLADAGLTLGEKVNIGVTSTILGIGVVFAALVILAVFMALLVRVVDGPANKPPDPPKKATPAPETVQASAPQLPADAVQAGISPKIVAAIVTAISAATGHPAANLKFTSISRKEGLNPQWTANSTAQLINNRTNYLNN